LKKPFVGFPVTNNIDMCGYHILQEDIAFETTLLVVATMNKMTIWLSVLQRFRGWLLMVVVCYVVTSVV
jgi:hypothetical protein